MRKKCSSFLFTISWISSKYTAIYGGMTRLRNLIGLMRNVTFVHSSIEFSTDKGQLSTVLGLFENILSEQLTLDVAFTRSFRIGETYIFPRPRFGKDFAIFKGDFSA